MIKDLPKKFVKNCDGVGDNTFIQIKKECNVYMYRRERMDGTLKGFEVFIGKFIAKGTPLPGGAVEKEDRIQYPGSAAFGKIAFDCRTEEDADARFEYLLQKSKDKQDAKEEAIKTGKPNKGRRSKAKVDVQPPTGKRFTMKFLMQMTQYSQPQLYPILQNWVKSGVVTVVGKEKAEGRGKPSLVYEVV